jgi:FxsC-like protein
MPNAVDLRSRYFFLSYAHSPPLAGAPPEAPDRWVRTFFRDLTDAVNRLGSGRMDIAPGFFDQEIPLGDNWRVAFADALSAAEVFVPLYSPGYFDRSWPGREWECFRRRLIAADTPSPGARFLPVLWIPLNPGQKPDLLERALALGATESAYAENGLRALLRLAPYRESYRRIVERLAGQIVELVETAPIGPSVAPDIDTVRSPFCADDSAVGFVVAVATAPHLDVPVGGESAMPWQPFPEIGEASLTQYAATLAEQLDFAVVLASLDKAEGEFNRNPGVILIDPWYVADEKRLRELIRVTGALPSWVLPVVVVNPAASQRETELAQRVKTILEASRAGRTEMATEAVAGVRSLEQFVTLMPFLIAEAERQYLRGGPTIPSTARKRSRPTLFGGEWMASPVAGSPKEDRDD